MFKLQKIKVQGIGVFKDAFELNLVDNNDLDNLLEDGKSTIIKSIINVLNLDDNLNDNKFLKTFNYDGDSIIELQLLINNRLLVLTKNLNTNEIENNDKILFNLYEKYIEVLSKNISINEKNIDETKNITTLIKEIKSSLNIDNMKLNNTEEIINIKNLLDLETFTSKEEFYKKLDTFEFKLLEEIKNLEDILNIVETKYKKLSEIDEELEIIEKINLKDKIEENNQLIEMIRNEIEEKRNKLSNKNNYTFDEMKQFIITINESNLFNKDNLEKIISFFDLVEEKLKTFSKLEINLIDEFLKNDEAISIFEQLYKIESEVETEEEYYGKFKEIFKPYKDNILMNKIFEIFENDFEQIISINEKLKYLKDLHLWDKIIKFHKSDDFKIIYEKRNNLLNYLKNIIFYLTNNEIVLDKNIQKYIEKCNSIENDYNEKEFKIKINDLNKLFDDLEDLLETEKYYNEKTIEETKLKEEKILLINVLNNDYNDLIKNNDLNLIENLKNSIQINKDEFKEIQNIRTNYIAIIEKLFENKQQNELEKARVLINVEKDVEETFTRLLNLLTDKPITIVDGSLMLNNMPIEMTKNEDKLLYKLVYVYIYNLYLNINVETSLLLIDNLFSYVKNQNFNILETIEKINKEKIQIIYHK